MGDSSQSIIVHTSGQKRSVRATTEREIYEMLVELCGPFPRRVFAINFGALKLLSIMFLLHSVAAQRWINIDYRFIKRKFIKDISSVDGMSCCYMKNDLREARDRKKFN